MSAYDGFAKTYDDFAAAMTEDIPFYVSLAAEARGPVIELAVGTGRVAVPIVAETGRRLIGIDASEAMLDLARARALTAGVELELRHGDMRDLELDEPTDLVICPFRAMLHLPTHDDRVAVMRRVAAALVPSGRFAWNTFVFDPAVAAELGGHWRVENGVRHRSDYDYEARRIDLALESGASVPLWWVDRPEWEAAIGESGLEAEMLYGWFDRRPFDESSSEFVWVTRKP